MLLPKTKTTDIIIQELGSELLLYDLKINKAYALNETLKIVYQSCDGQTSYETLKRRYRHLNDDVIKLSISELSRENLLVENLENIVSRRNLLTRAALAAAALPIITVIVAPTVADAQSGCVAGGSPCNLNNPGACCSQTCLNNGGNSVCASTCTPDGSPCSLNNPGACCSLTCLNNGGNSVCGNTCLTAGTPCNLNNPGACCSQTCLNNGGNSVCSA